MDGIYYAKAAAAFGAALTMAIGTLGPALAQGQIGAEAMRSFVKYPEGSNTLRTLMILALGLVEAMAIYCLLIAGALSYVAYSLQG